MFTLPELGYEYDALAPAISADIMKLHHAKHHQTYVDKLNAALKDSPDLQNNSIEELLGSLSSLPESVRTAVRNNGGGHYNHSLFWKWLSPQGGGEPTGELASHIATKYGDFQTFVSVFTEKSLGVFGSGWVWLQPDMSIITTANQDTPISDGKSPALLGLDVWEHAYYLDYKNVRADYLAAWWDVVDWKYVEQRFIEAQS